LPIIFGDGSDEIAPVTPTLENLYYLEPI